MTPFLSVLDPYVPLFVVLAVLVVLFTAPIPGRGPGVFRRRDPWRGYKFGPRRTVMAGAGGRCEAGSFFVCGRCREQATEVDHVYPWSRGGPTVVSNGQALCRTHNRRKSSLRPPWWYVWALERRRSTYFPADATCRVLARMTDDERAARAAGMSRRKRRS